MNQKPKSPLSKDLKVQIPLLQDIGRDIHNGQQKTNRYSPVKALPHTAPYKIHKYFARRPWNVFKSLIEAYSSPGDLILDPFCGGGVTVYEGLRLGRKVVGCDLNPLSTFIVSNMIKQPRDFEELTGAFEDCCVLLNSIYGNYSLLTNEGTFQVDWCELAFEVLCDACGTRNVLKNDRRIKNGVYKCENLSCQSAVSKNKGFTTRQATRVGYKYLFCIGKRGKERRSFAVDNRVDEMLGHHLEFLRDLIKREKIEVPQDLIPIDWDRQFEDGLKNKNIVYFQDLFTERNLLISLLLLKRIQRFENKISRHNYELLRLAFSNTVKDTNIMSFTNEAWQSGNPTTWSKHAYWIPNQFCEVNVLQAFSKAFAKVKASLEFNFRQPLAGEKKGDLAKLRSSEGGVLILNDSVANCEIPSNSIDAIITDPPYGSNVQYLELSHFWYPWNRDLYEAPPRFAEEAVANRKKGFKGAKSMYDYEENLFKVFKECHEVLKNDGFMVMTFNNKNMNAWLALMFAVFRAGFSLERDGLIFQDGVKNYKQTAHTRFEGAPYGDFIYTFKKSYSAPIRAYSREQDFFADINSIFKSYIEPGLENRNEVVVNMLLAAVPAIESFAKSYLRDNKHYLYSKFADNFLEELY